LTNWPAVWVIYIAGLAAAAFITKVAPALPLLRQELGLTLVESSFIATTFNLIGMATGLLAGMLCDRHGQKRLGVSGLLIMAAGGALGFAASGFPMLLVSRVVEGMGFILFAVAAPSLMSAATGTAHDRAKSLGLWSSYMPAGGALMLFAAPSLIAAWGWRGLWAAATTAALASAVAVVRAAPSPSHGAVQSWRLIAEAVAQPGNLVMGALFGCYVAQWTSVMIWLPTFLIEEHGLAAGSAALATAVMVLVNAPGNLAGGWLLGHGVRRVTLVVTACGIAALCEIGMLTAALPGALRFAAVLVFSFCVGVIPASIFSGLPVHAKTPQHVATGNGIIMHGSNFGQFLGPLALAWIASRFGGWQATLWPMLGFAFLATLCGLLLGRIERTKIGA
jgi:MFS transporter, DHA1 family, inner membrane transport protein